MVPLVVDPEALFAAGSAVVASGDGLNADLRVSTAGFSANTGLDTAGVVFGLQYQSSAESLLKAAAAVINACRFSGAKIQVGASNYSRAEAASRLGGGGDVLPPPGDPVKIAPPGPPGTLGPGEPPPALWGVIQSFVDDVWPDGDAAGLHAAAGRWRGFGAALTGIRGALDGSKSIIGAQKIAEGEKVIDVLSQICGSADKIGAQCGKLATTLDNFADEVSHAQSAIRDLLHRLGSLADFGHDVMLVFEGKALDELEEIARDVNVVLHTLAREAKASEQSMTLSMQIIDGWVVDMEKSVRGEFKHFLGDTVGNQVATVFDTWVNLDEGAFKGLVGMVQGIEALDPLRFLYDPDGAAATWKGMTRTGLLNHLLNPQDAWNADKQMFRSVLHLDDWRGDRPGLGAGEDAFDVATLFLPGVGEAGAGAKGAAGGARAAGEGESAAGAAARAGDVTGATGELGEIGATGSGLTKDLEGAAGEMPEIEVPASGAPVALPTDHLPEVSVESTPYPVDPVPAGGVHDPVPAGVAHEPTPAPSGVPTAPTAAAEPVGRLPSFIPRLAESEPAMPVPPGGSPAEPVPAAARAPQQAPAVASSAPHSPAPSFTAPGGHPAELPAPHGGEPRGPGDGEHGGPPDGAGSGPGHGDPQHGAHEDPVHSTEPAGEGWHRLADKPIDPHYGEPLPEHWDFPDNPAEPGKMDPIVAKLMRDPQAPFGRDLRGDAYTAEQYAERFNKLSPHDEHWANFPGNDGATVNTKVEFTDGNRFVGIYGSRMDRIGPITGKYFAVMEDGIPASWEARALHVDSLAEPYQSYLLNELPDGWRIEVSEVAAGMGQPGASLQVRILNSEGRIMTAEELTDLGVLR